MIIGFGSTETALESQIEKELSDLVERQYQDESSDYFNDDFVALIKALADDMASESHRESDKYREAEKFPDRYSSFWIYTLGDRNHIAFIVTFHHINRRHAFSPDGWAMMRTERTFSVAHQDMKRKQRSAA